MFPGSWSDIGFNQVYHLGDAQSAKRDGKKCTDG
jgi:hypothetical protein